MSDGHVLRRGPEVDLEVETGREAVRRLEIISTRKAPLRYSSDLLSAFQDVIGYSPAPINASLRVPGLMRASAADSPHLEPPPADPRPIPHPSGQPACSSASAGFHSIFHSDSRDGGAAGDGASGEPAVKKRRCATSTSTPASAAMSSLSAGPVPLSSLIQPRALSGAAMNAQPILDCPSAPSSESIRHAHLLLHYTRPLEEPPLMTSPPTSTASHSHHTDSVHVSAGRLPDPASANAAAQPSHELNPAPLFNPPVVETVNPSVAIPFADPLERYAIESITSPTSS